MTYLHIQKERKEERAQGGKSTYHTFIRIFPSLSAHLFQFDLHFIYFWLGGSPNLVFIIFSKDEQMGGETQTSVLIYDFVSS